MGPLLRRISLAIGWAVVVWALTAPPVHAATSPPAGSWIWPVRGEVIRGFEPPPTPYSPGHRGIDIAAPFGTPIRSPADGVVSFAGTVAGTLFLTIDHGDGYRSTCSWVSQVFVAPGQNVRAGVVVGLTGHGHPEVDTPHLHFGVRLNGDYIDPLPLLGSESVVDLIRLAPLEDESPQDAQAISARAAPVPKGIRLAVLRAFLLRDRIASGVSTAAAPSPRPARDPPRRPLE